FIIGLKRLGKPDTARSGNQISAAGMLLAIVVALFDRAVISYEVIIAGMIVGGGAGYWLARTVQMTAMPQMVALLNGFGGGASLLVGASEFLYAESAGLAVDTPTSVAVHLGVIIGAITFTGSGVAFAKLQELVTSRPLTFKGQQVFNALLLLSILAIAAYQIITPDPLLSPFYMLCGLALVLGVMLVLPIGGADRPVVISLLNSDSGIAVAMTGCAIGNEVISVAGALMVSSGIILTQIMCRAMNRSLANVLFGAFGSVTTSPRTSVGLTVRTITAEGAAI